MQQNRGGCRRLRQGKSKRKSVATSVGSRIALVLSLFWFIPVAMLFIFGGPWTQGQDLYFFLIIWGVPSVIVTVICRGVEFIITGR